MWRKTFLPGQEGLYSIEVSVSPPMEIIQLAASFLYKTVVYNCIDIAILYSVVHIGDRDFREFMNKELPPDKMLVFLAFLNKKGLRQILA